MSADSQKPPSPRRASILIGIGGAIFAVGWWLLAPQIQSWRGNSDEAAWLPLFLIPTSLLALSMAGLTLGAKGMLPRILLLLALLAHLLVGLGLHPR